MEKPMKVFISHSSKDLAYVQPLVELLEQVGLNEDDMFCSSVPGYNIPLDSNILEYLKEQFENYHLRVIFVLSDNYYRSPVSLNEMGAAWVLQHRYTSVLIPKFDFKDIKGAIDDMRISIRIDADEVELKTRLNELRETLIQEFGLRKSVASHNIWERHRDEFIRKVNSIEIHWKTLQELKEKKSPITEWVLPLQKVIESNPLSFDAMYILGSIYAEMNEIENAVKYLMNATLAPNVELARKAKKRLRDLGYSC